MRCDAYIHRITGDRRRTRKRSFNARRRRCSGNIENKSVISYGIFNHFQNLVKVSIDKVKQQTLTYKTTPRSSYCNANLDIPAQRNSLPDIPLTPRERQILEQTSSGPCMVRSSHSTESILRDSSPPPKPPLPDR